MEDGTRIALTIMTILCFVPCLGAGGYLIARKLGLVT
jgi:hypothetical protein